MINIRYFSYQEVVLIVPAKHVIHKVGPIWNGGINNEELFNIEERRICDA